ncbi:SDR family oxidoreductase [Virgibacillus halophilus]|uniref:SDR family NAD(P)-dependent oxidoreductase n=1 Tax=Tigheibacillus halophilus TaxID=361280 RepID=A0ABU5C8W0_9BACI|nr:SDR family NAD(P)-dependent oxidoreductase [Virgibacillus halophilus]
MASDSGFEVTERLTVYCATKFAVRAISTGLEKELAKTGVRVSNILPGMVEPPLSSRSPFESDRKKLELADIARAVLCRDTARLSKCK